jgi:hypothetical protein
MAEQPDAPDTHEHNDHCVCDIDLHDDEITSDADLPVAAGGVAAAGGQPPAEDSDGCDIDFSTAEPTNDDELPVTVGGVA